MTVTDKIKQVIRDVPDFPKPGILFKDISTLLLDPELSREMLDQIRINCNDLDIQGVAGIESRGFLFGLPLAMALDVPFVMIRKKGKLPYKTVSYAYDLEYGQAEIEMHVDAIQSGQRILIHDDLLATGGSASAAAELIRMQGGVVAGFDFIVELSFLKGRDNLNSYSENITNLVSY